MWTIPGLLGLVLMLLASAETKSRKLQSLTSDTAARIEFNNTEILQEVNTGSAHIIPILKVVISENYCSKEFLSILLQKFAKDADNNSSHLVTIHHTKVSE